MDLGDGIDRDANGYAYKDGITSQVKRQQVVVNESWPERDEKGFHARGIRPAQHDDGSPWSIDVDVRLELEHDGVVVLPGRAERWNSTHVFVTAIADPRVPKPGVWVLARDVRRH